MLRRAASEASLHSVVSHDGMRSPHVHDRKHHRRHDYHRIDPSRSAEPVFASVLQPSDAARWTALMRATHLPGPPRVDAAGPDGRPPPPRDWLAQHPSGLDTPWVPPEKGRGADLLDGGHRRSLAQRILLVLARHPVIPPLLRGIVWLLCLVALVLGAELLRGHPAGRSRSSPVMAVAVDAVALVYLFFVGRDEFGGGPVGMRDARAKLRLLLLDLVFMVFAAANLALAFETALEDGPSGQDTRLQAALAAILTTALVSWMMTFSVSALGIVDKAVG